ncbi:MAG TPA: hypothetical protein VEL31_20335 [Ktedonobacteraceae bacterium]|nr:hypothetical protein [Ktedonobacteraceae bacterium]
MYRFFLTLFTKAPYLDTEESGIEDLADRSQFLYQGKEAKGKGDLLLQPIMKKLSALDTFCESWHDGSFQYENISGKITPESNETLKKYTDEHTFLCPDGTYRLFSWHARLTPSAWRIYFYVDEKKKLLTIGHIGHKLPNVLYPT